MTKTNVTLLGYYGYQNAGDEWLCEQSKRVIIKAWPSAHIEVVSRKSITSVFLSIVRSDVLVLGGGSLFQDKSSRLSLLFYAACCALAIGLGHRVIVLANGIGPVSTEMGKWVMHRLSPRFSLVVARDSESFQLFKRFGVSEGALVQSTDLAFFEKSHIDEPVNPLYFSNYDESKTTIGINLRPTAFQSRLKAALSKLPFSNRVGIPAHYEQDPDVIHSIYPNLRLHPLPLSIDDAKRETAPCQVLIAMRFHAILWAVWHHIPCIAIADDDKTMNFARELGVPIIDLRSLSYESDAKIIFTHLFESSAHPVGIQYDVDSRVALANHLPEVLRRYA